MVTKSGRNADVFMHVSVAKLSTGPLKKYVSNHRSTSLAVNQSDGTRSVS